MVIVLPVCVCVAKKKGERGDERKMGTRTRGESASGVERCFGGVTVGDGQVVVRRTLGGWVCTAI